MKIAILGAAGQTGQQLTRLALAGGHAVSVLVRNPDKLDRAQEMRVVAGDATDAGAVGDVLTGVDCAISALGSGRGTLAGFARAAVPIMEDSGPRRLVSLVGAGVAEPGDPASFGRTVMLTLMRLMARDVLEDASEHARLVRASSLDWTLVRPPRLTNDAATGKIVSAPHLQLGPAESISRADLAAFMLDVATSDKFLRQSPMVANARQGASA